MCRWRVLCQAWRICYLLRPLHIVHANATTWFRQASFWLQEPPANCAERRTDSLSQLVIYINWKAATLLRCFRKQWNNLRTGLKYTSLQLYWDRYTRPLLTATSSHWQCHGSSLNRLLLTSATRTNWPSQQLIPADSQIHCTGAKLSFSSHHGQYSFLVIAYSLNCRDCGCFRTFPLMLV